MRNVIRVSLADYRFQRIILNHFWLVTLRCMVFVLNLCVRSLSIAYSKFRVQLSSLVCFDFYFNFINIYFYRLQSCGTHALFVCWANATFPLCLYRFTSSRFVINSAKRLLDVNNNKMILWRLLMRSVFPFNAILFHFFFHSKFSAVNKLALICLQFDICVYATRLIYSFMLVCFGTVHSNDFYPTIEILWLKFVAQNNRECCGKKNRSAHWTCRKKWRKKDKHQRTNHSNAKSHSRSHILFSLSHYVLMHCGNRRLIAFSVRERTQK